MWIGKEVSCYILLILKLLFFFLVKAHDALQMAIEAKFMKISNCYNCVKTI